MTNQVKGFARPENHEHDSTLHRGALPSWAIQPEYELTIPEVCEKFNVHRRILELWISAGVVRFRMDGDMVYFHESEVTDDIKLARIWYTFKTSEERQAFLIGAKRPERAWDHSRHYVFGRGKGNSKWLAEMNSNR